MGFKALVAWATRWGGDLEVAAQSVPFVLGLLGVGAVGALAFRLSNNVWVAFLAAAWVGLDAVFVVQMARVKPYTCDVLVVALQGLAFAALMDGYTRRRLWAFFAVVVVGAIFSSLSIFPATAALMVGAGVFWRRGVRDGHAVVVGVLLVSGLAAVVSLAVGASGGDALRAFWQAQFLPAHDLGAFAAGVGRWVGSWAARLLHLAGPQAGPLVLPGALAAGLAIAGGIELWLLGRRAHLAVGVLLLAGVALASASQVLPVGVARVETFLLPFAAVLLANAAGLVMRCPRRALSVMGVVLLVVGVLVQFPTSRRGRYPVQQASPVVDQLVRAFRPGDGLWVNLRGTYSLALYGPWPVRYVENGQLGIPHAVPELAAFAVLNPRDEGRVASAPPLSDRIFVFVCSGAPVLTEQAARQLLEAEYTREGWLRGRRCSVEWFARAGGRP